MPGHIDDGPEAELVTRKFQFHEEFAYKAVTRGGEYVGSWRDISRWGVKTLAIRSTLSGTLQIITAMANPFPHGSHASMGTYYESRIGQGTYSTKSFSEALGWGKAKYHSTGTSVTGKGTLNLFWGGQV